MSAPIPVLVVEPTVDDLFPLVSALTEAGFQVTATGTFLHARTLLDARPPALLITAVRLGLYNGLHLVLRGTAVKPDLAAVVTSTVADPVLQREAEALGATFVVTPVEQKDLLAAALRTLFRGDRAEGAIRTPFERRVLERRTHVEFRVSDRRVAQRRRALSSPLPGITVQHKN
jgi:DNA-binding NtrC family response regulator